MMLTPLKILILENSLADTDLMLYELRRAGLKLDWQRVETEPDYLARLNTGYDVILADYSMPQFSAMRALQLLQERSLDIPFIVVTGSTSEEIAVESMRRGAADYLLKDRLVRLGPAVMQAVQQKKLRDEKRQAETALQASEARFRRLADNAQDIIYRYRFTPTRGFEYLSPSVTTIMGYTPEEHYADPDLIFKTIAHKEDLRLLQQWVIGEELAQPAVLRWVGKDGAIVWTEHSNVPIHDEAGNIIAAEGIARNVTSRKQAEAALQQQTERERLVAEIAQRIRQSLDLEEILNTTVREVQQFLQTDRVIVLRFESDWSGVVVVESVAAGWAPTLGKTIDNPCLRDFYVPYYRQGHISALDDINATSLDPYHIDLLAQFQVRADLVVPIVQGEELWGLLIAHQCSGPRRWKPLEINLLKQLATQVAIAIQQAQLFNQVQQQAQREQLLNQISGALNSSLDPEHILQEIVRLAGEGFGVDRVVIYGLRGEYSHVLNEWRVNDQVPLVNDLWVSHWSEWPLPKGFISSSRQVFHAPDYVEIPRTPVQQTRVHQAQILSVLGAPIFIHDQFFGGLSLHTIINRRTFTEDEIHLLQRIADQTAIALYNAQSYERLELLVKERTEELEQEKRVSDAANRAKSAFLANMSHELRTPLNNILGYSKVLLEQIFGSLNDKQQQYLDRLHTSGQHLLDLMNDLLDLSKIEAGREEMTLEALPVEEICRECLSLIHEQAVSRGLQLSLIIAPDVSTCIADRRRLKQILANLLSNAVKFTEAGSITLKVELAKNTINFSVIDTGIGIAKADQAILFQPFQQLDSHLAHRYKGTGLGLALSRRLAQLHGGDITLQSKWGHGSCLTLHLPVRAVN